MKKESKLIKILPVLAVISLILLILIFPEKCVESALKGVVLCGKVLIPSLFPFSVCVLYIMRSGILNKLSVIQPLTIRVLGQSSTMFGIMCLSFIGGYPIGAKLIDELYINGGIDKRSANLMQCYCINAGPAFIVLAIGQGVLSSKKAGYILFLSHIFASIIISLILSFKMKENRKVTQIQPKNKISITENFVKSTADAAATVLGICGYVILFSTINGYILHISNHLYNVKFLLYLTEVTTSVSYTKNLFFISFLLGFSGFSIWCQVISAAKNTGICFKIFVPYRILHGIISALICFLLTKLFPVTISVFSNSIPLISKITTLELFSSLIIMIILLIISVETKILCGKLIDDML